MDTVKDGEDNIRKVIAFSKNNKNRELMAERPTKVDFNYLLEL